MSQKSIIHLKETPSTNEHLKSLMIKDEVREGQIVVTDFQTKGKGQRGNTWESETGKNLTFSFFLRPTFLPAEKMFLISKAVSLGLIDYLNSLEKTFTIKWPNDIYYCDKKVAGILIENQLSGNHIETSIIGIGLNVNQTEFPKQLHNAISLATIFKREFNLSEVLASVYEEIDTWYRILSDGWDDRIDYMYFSHLFRNEGYHEFILPTRNIHAKIVSVEPDGKLTLKSPQGEIFRFYFKEIDFAI